jgi:methanogenic corrinoid protein MtbC1
MSKLLEITAAVETGKAKLMAGLVEEALAEGHAPLEILNDGMIRAMENIGEKFRRNEVFVPEMLIAARAMKKGMETLEPHLGGESMASSGKFIVGTVQGDLHDIGKNLVAMMVGSVGFEVIDLGVDVSAERYVKAVRDNAGDRIVVGLSSLLTTTMPAMKATVEALRVCRI